VAQRPELLGQTAAARRQLLQRLLAGAGWAAGSAGAAAATPRAGDAPSSPAVPAAIRDQGYRLAQNWDFASTVTDDKQLREAFVTRFIYEGGKLDKLNDEWQRYRDHDNHVFEDGALALVARAPTEVASGKIESGMLRSKWSGQYGYFECRMKVPGGRGMWPAFWLNPQDQKWPPEIDILEIVNNGRDSSRNSFHFLHSGVKESLPVASSLLNNNKTYKPGFDYQDDFHTFAVEWTAERVRHFVDDVLVVDRAFRWVHKDGSDGGPAHVLVNLAVGGKWTGPPAGPEAFPAKLLLKYIRVWQR
jgi:beta-glucanase (GH16 family)